MKFLKTARKILKNNRIRQKKSHSKEWDNLDIINFRPESKLADFRLFEFLFELVRLLAL